MPIYEEEPVRRRVVEEPVVERRVVEEPVQRRVVRGRADNDGLAGYALVKYGFILVMTLIILYFLANYILPRLG